MTYSAFISFVQSQMRDATSFPDASGDAAKLLEQLRLCYISVLVVLANLPEAEQTPFISAEALTAVTNNPTYRQLPSDRFFALPNSGLRRVVLDNVFYALSKAQSRAFVEAQSSSRFQRGAVLFAFDEQLNHVITPTDKVVKVEYVKLPLEPTVGTYEDDQIPLSNPHIQRAAELVMARLYGFQQDSYYQQFHQMWSKIYGLNPVEVSA